MLARSVYPPIVLTYYERFRNYVANPVTIPVRLHLIASSIPTYCRKRNPVILATATPYLPIESSRRCVRSSFLAPSSMSTWVMVGWFFVGKVWHIPKISCFSRFLFFFYSSSWYPSSAVYLLCFHCLSRGWSVCLRSCFSVSDLVYTFHFLWRLWLFVASIS